MRFGVCCSLENAPIALRAGADYVELPAWPLVKDAEYRKALTGLPVEAVNLFLPSGLTLIDNYEDCLAHGRAVVEEAESLGIAVAVVGSGGARRFPDDEKLRGFITFVEAVQTWSRHATTIKIAPESLNRDETNVGNDLHELATLLLEKGVGFTADSYHVLREWQVEGEVEDLPALWEYHMPTPPVHVHVSDCERRPPAKDDESIASFLRRLKQLRYDDRMSFECRWDDFADEVGLAIDRLRSTWELA